MYKDYFNLQKDPFLMTPDPSALMLTNTYKEALAGLSYGALDKKGFVVLSGEAGTGKTTLLRRLLELGGAAGARCSVVFHPLLTAAEFLELLLINFGVRDVPVSKAQRLYKLEQVLLETHRAGRTAVLIVDEAHKLSHEIFEEIRLLTNFETADEKLLQIVLSGQPELGGVLNHPNLWQLKQRIAIRVNLDPLTGEEVRQFIDHRWKFAGGHLPVPFSKEATSLIELCSQGIPRLINSLCSNGLLQAMGRDSHDVSGDDILQVILDLDLPVPLRRIHVKETAASRSAWSRQRALLAGNGDAVITMPVNGNGDHSAPSYNLFEHEPPSREVWTSASSEAEDTGDSYPDPVAAAPVDPEPKLVLKPQPQPDPVILPKLPNPRVKAFPAPSEPIRLRRLTRYQVEPPPQSLVNRLFATLGI